MGRHGALRPALDHRMRFPNRASGGPSGSARRSRPGRHRSASTHTRVRRWAPIVVGVATVILVRLFVIQSFWIPSASMEPTLHGCPGCRDDHVLVSRLSYTVHAIHRGDIVVFHRPPGVREADNFLIKRVIGLPGETISAVAAAVHVGDRALAEPYVNPSCAGTADFLPVRVPAHHVFVLGDNRCDSADSRAFGSIAMSSIVGPAVVRVWPLWRLKWL